MEISWDPWVLAATVPGLVSRAALPWVRSQVYPPTLKQTPEAPQQAGDELADAGPMSRHEVIMAATFAGLLLTRCLDSLWDLNATAVAFVGVAVAGAVGGLPWIVAFAILALAFGFIGSIWGGLTHCASGPAGVVYGSGYGHTDEWFRVGFIMSVLSLFIWTVVGGAWRRVLGMW